MGLGRRSEAGSSAGSLRSIPKEYTPLLSGNAKHQRLSSGLKTFANVVLAIVGAGVLGLPYTFMRTGWLTCLVMIFFVAALTYRGMMLLVDTRRKIADSPTASFPNPTSFGDLGYASCGSVGRFSVDILIVLSQTGFCVGYLIFIGNTLSNLFTSSVNLSIGASPEIWGISAKAVYIWGCFPFQLGLNSIRSLTVLAPLSIIADVLDIGAKGVVMVEDMVIFFKQMPVIEAFGTVSSFFYGLGVIVYSFEGIGMALPLEAEMKEKSKYGKILALAILFIACMFGGFGALGYFAYGESTSDIITANMGKGLLSVLIQLALCVNLFISFPLMMNPVHEVFERRFWFGRYCLLLRWALVLFSVFVALFVPSFADFLSLVGSSTCCILGFVLPALFHYLAFKQEMNLREAIADIVVIIVGLLLGVSGTWYSLLEIFSVKA